MEFKQISVKETICELLKGTILYNTYQDSEGSDIEFYSYQYCMLITKDNENVYLWKSDDTSKWVQCVEIRFSRLIEEKWYIEKIV